MDATLSYEQALDMNADAVQEYKTLGDLYMQQIEPRSRAVS